MKEKNGGYGQKYVEYVDYVDHVCVLPCFEAKNQCDYLQVSEIMRIFASVITYFHYAK